MPGHRIGPRSLAKKISVAVSPEERNAIDRLAARSNLTVADYLRRVGLGYRPLSTVDNDAVDALIALKSEVSKLLRIGSIPDRRMLELHAEMGVLLGVFWAKVKKRQ